LNSHRYVEDKVKGSGLTEEEMDVLAGFVIHQAELDKASKGGEGEKGEIELAEWQGWHFSRYLTLNPKP
jgi:hypothetical protein